MDNPNPLKPEEVVEYNENTAILKKKILIALVATEKGPGVYACLLDRESIIMAKGEIDAYLTMILVKGDLRADAARNKVVPAPHGIMNFVKKGRF